MMREECYSTMPMAEIVPPMQQPDLRTGVGHGHARSATRERPPKGALVKKRKRAKVSKASRKKNRR